MSRSSIMSPLGLFNWDNTIFDLMVIPSELDREILINNLLAETAELEVIYPNPTVFKNLLGIWSHKQLDIWNRLYNTTQYEYNPIENYDRYEEGTDSDSGSTQHSGIDTHSDRVANSGEDTIEASRKDESYIASFDSTPSGDDDGLVKKTRTESTSGSTTEYGKIEDSSGNVAYGHKLEMENEREHEFRAHGNIGTMTVQQMIEEQREIEKFNLYDIIIEEFKMRFCILIY